MSLCSGLDLYTASDHLPTTLLSKDKGFSYDVDKTAFQNAVNTTKSRWDWLEEKVPLKDLRCENSGYPGAPELVPSFENGVANVSPTTNGHSETKPGKELYARPEHAIFGLAMVGGGKITGAAHVEGRKVPNPPDILDVTTN